MKTTGERLDRYAKAVAKERRKTHAARAERLREERLGIREQLDCLMSMEASGERLATLSQSIAKYIAYSHHGMFWRLHEGTERREDVRLVARSIYPRLETSASKLLDAAARCEDSVVDRARVTRELRTLEAIVSEHFALEDELLAAMVMPSAARSQSSR